MRLQHLRLDSIPVLPPSEDLSILLPPSLCRVGPPTTSGVYSNHVSLRHLVSTPTPSISHSVLIAGTESILTCDYNISLGPYVDSHVAENVSWMVNGSAVATNGRKRISNNGLILFLSPVSVSDSGRYTCQLRLSAPQTPYVSVHGPVQSSNEVITVKSKQPAQKRQKR